MVSTSNSYNFQSITVETIIREAYERIGLIENVIVTQQLEAATRSLNFMLTDWSNRHINLWTLGTSYLGLVGGKPSYTLPTPLADVIQVNLRTSNRQNFGGTPSADVGITVGTLASLFDNEVVGLCTLAANGAIAYDYGVNNSQTLTFLGVKSQIDATWTIVFEGSNDGVSWNTIVDLGTVAYIANTVSWFDAYNINPYRRYRIRQTGGAVPLSLQKLFFNNNISDTSMSEISRYEYLTYPQKHQIGRPTTYYVDRQIEQTIYLWPAPSTYYNCINYSYQQMIQDIGSYTNTPQVPSIFYEPLAAGLAYKLAIKFKPELVAQLKPEYETALAVAMAMNTESVPLRIYGDYTDEKYR